MLVSACYRDGTVERCAVTCNPLDNHCPGGLLCGTDSYCHAPNEGQDVCIFQLNDAKASPDVAIRDAPPVDAVPSDAFTKCPGGVWQADFSTNPLDASWVGSGFDFAKDVTNMVWTPVLDKESLTTSPPTAFMGLTLFQTRVNAKVVQQGHIHLHLEAGESDTVLVDIDVSHVGSQQVYSTTLTGAIKTTTPGTMSVDPHLMIGKLDYQGRTFKLFIDDATNPVQTLTFDLGTSKSGQTFSVTADTNTAVDDLGVCAM